MLFDNNPPSHFREEIFSEIIINVATIIHSGYGYKMNLVVIDPLLAKKPYPKITCRSIFKRY